MMKRRNSVQTKSSNAAPVKKRDHRTQYEDMKLECLELINYCLKNFTPQEIDDACRIHFSEIGDTIPEIDTDKLNSDIEAFVKMPLSARDDSFLKKIKNDLLLSEIKTKRRIQLEELKVWEREINDISISPKPIKVINEVDLETKPIDFVYINKRITGCGVKILEAPELTPGCDCKKCSKKCSCKRLEGTPPYKNDGSLNVSQGTPIYECNFMCKCSSECMNRIVQRGRQASLAIFKTNDGRGWGLKTLEKIQKGRFVTEYVGEVITSSEVERRLRKYKRAKLGNYMFDLDFNTSENCPFSIDGTLLGNESHFINHSCDPNLTVFCVYIDSLDPEFPHITFFANRTIKPGEELTCDYFLDVPTSHDSQPPDSSFFTVCKCGSDNCRKYYVSS